MGNKQELLQKEKRILLLGSRGFLGRVLVQKLENNSELWHGTRENLGNLASLSEVNFDFVINAMASQPSASAEEAFLSNFYLPKVLLESLNFAKWIQLNSYFQLQIPMGRSDPYTLSKEEFKALLDDNRESVDFEVAHIYLPYLFGTGDKVTRLIASARLSFQKKEMLRTSEGYQQIPILFSEDAALGIIKFLENPVGTAACCPFWYGTARELILAMAAQFQDSRVAFGVFPHSIDYDYPKVSFPNCVQNWSPTMDWRKFLMWVEGKTCE